MATEELNNVTGDPTPKPQKQAPAKPAPKVPKEWTEGSYNTDAPAPEDWTKKITTTPPKGPKKKPSADLSGLRDIIRQGTEAQEANTRDGMEIQPGQMPSGDQLLELERQRKAAKKASAELKAQEIQKTKELQPYFNDVSNYLLGEKGEKLKDYLMKTPAGNDEIDYEKVMKAVDEFNYNGDNNTRALLINNVIAKGRQQILERDANYEKLKMTKKTVTPDDFSKQANAIMGQAAAMQKTNLETVKKMAQEEYTKIDKVFQEAIKPVRDIYQGGIDVLKDEFDETEAIKVQNDFEAFRSQQEERVNRGEITPQDYMNLISKHQKDIEDYMKNSPAYQKNKQAFVDNEFQKRYGEDFATDIADFVETRTEALRELNVRSKKMLENLNRASKVFIDAKIDELDAKRFSAMTDDMLNTMESYKIVQDKREQKEEAYRDASWAPKVLQKKLGGAIGNLSKSLGQFINSLDIEGRFSLEGSLGDKLEAGGANLATSSYIKNKELTFSNFFQPNMIAQVVGDVAGQQLPQVAALAGTYLLTKNPGLAVRVAGTMGTINNIATMGQDTYNSMLEKGYTVQEANEGKRKMMLAEVAMAPLEMIEMGALINNWLGKGIASRAANSLVSGATEFFQEHTENATQNSIVDNKSFTDTFFTTKGMEQDASAGYGAFWMNMLLGGGGGNGKKPPVPGLTPQKMADIIERKGADFQNMLLEFKYNQGDLNEQQLVELKQETQRVAGLLEQGKQLELTKPQLQMFVGISTEIDTLEKRAAALSDKALKETIEKQISEKKAQLEEVINNPDSIAVIKLPTGGDIATTTDGALEALSTTSGEEAIKAGAIQVESTDSKIEDKKAEILSTPIETDTRISRKEDLAAEVQTLGNVDLYGIKLESDGEVMIDVTDPASGEVSSAKVKASRAQSTLRKKHFDLRKVLDCITK